MPFIMIIKRNIHMSWQKIQIFSSVREDGPLVTVGVRILLK